MALEKKRISNTETHSELVAKEKAFSQTLHLKEIKTFRGAPEEANTLPSELLF